MPDNEYMIRNLPGSPKAFDAALLPPEAGRRLQVLRDAAHDAKALSGGLGFRQIQLNDMRQAVSAGIRLLNSLHAGDDHPEMVRVKTELREIDDERARLDERLNLHHAATAHRGDLLRAVEDWLRVNHARHGFKQATVQAAPKKGETIGATVEKLRFRLRELSAEAARVEAAIYPLSVAVKVAKNAVEARARPPVASSCLEHAGPMIIGGRMVEQAIEFPKINFSAEVVSAQGQGVGTGVIDDVIGFLCWMMPDVIVSRITEDLLRPDADDANALTAEQRRSKLATISQDRLLVEAEEVELLFQALAGGTIIEARRDTSPQAFLGLVLVDSGIEQGFDHGEGVARGRRAHSPGNQTAGPGDIHIPGLTDIPS